VLAIDCSAKRALVTGAGQGVGREVARYLARAGAMVLVNDLVDERCESVVAEIRQEGLAAESLAFDVTSWEQIQAAIEKSGGVDILVNNAGNAGATGSFGLKTVAEEQPEEWAAFLKINLDGVMLCTRAVLPQMIEQGGGRIITVISDSARTGEPRMAAYAAAKAGAAGFLRSVASEVGRHGITANCIALGTMRTPLTGEDLEETNPEFLNKLLRNYAIRRRGEPADVAGLVAYLASPMASWLTGQTIPLNGGLSMAL
jgi:NAD(P)-dependent dehydrogenase (short-subunit alcohol dehydrogenase family)